jgi:hypothetical protein
MSLLDLSSMYLTSANGKRLACGCVVI